MIKARIIGTGSYLPKKVVTNFDLEKMVDTSDEWIRSRTGISERRIGNRDETTSNLAIHAANNAIKEAKIKPKEIDLIIVATATPDHPFPATACFVQEGLGLTNHVPAFDVSAVCSGFVYGLSVAEAYIKSGRYKTILLIGADVFSKFVDWKDRNTCVLFGDGAGAVIIRGEEKGKAGIISTHLHASGAQADFLIIPAGGSKHPTSASTVEHRQHYIQMKGNETFKMAVKMMCEAVREAVFSNGYKLEDIDLIIPHQANKRIIDSLVNNLEVPPEKVFMNLEKYGNTSAATIPVALDEALKEGRIKAGSLILMVAFGAGLTWGSALIKWGQNKNE